MTSAKPTAGAISTPHALATRTGAAMLEAGGNALDAALAAAAMLCVVYPNNVALGSDLVALVRHPDGRTEFVNGTGEAASGTDLDALRRRHGDALPVTGVDTINVPGAVRAWEAMHGLGATRGWADLLAPAVAAAERGVPLPSSVALGLLRNETVLRADPGCRELFFPDDRPLREGDPFVQPALGRSLRALAEGGPDEFYTGELGRRWLAGLRAQGSGLTADDLAAHRTEIDAPLSADFRGVRIDTGRPNSQGFMLLRALAEVAQLDGVEPLEAGAGLLGSAFLRANRVRTALLADPRSGGLSGEELLRADPDSLDDHYKGRPLGDTIGIAAVSDDGTAVSLIQSVFFEFGAAVLDEETGILFQNRGTSFSLDPAHPGAYAAGRRPAHTLMPVLVSEAGRLRWAAATMGGQGQPQVHAQLLLRALAGADPEAAVHAPRWIVGRQRLEDLDRTVTVEQGVSEAAIASLRAAGLEPKLVPRWDDAVGHANLVEVLPRGFAASSDPRSDGAAAVVAGE